MIELGLINGCVLGITFDNEEFFDLRIYLVFIFLRFTD